MGNRATPWAHFTRVAYLLISKMSSVLNQIRWHLRGHRDHKLIVREKMKIIRNKRFLILRADVVSKEICKLTRSKVPAFATTPI